MRKYWLTLALICGVALGACGDFVQPTGGLENGEGAEGGEDETLDGSVPGGDTEPGANTEGGQGTDPAPEGAEGAGEGTEGGETSEGTEGGEGPEGTEGLEGPEGTEGFEGPEGDEGFEGGECPAIGCANDCPFGFAVDEATGCPTCACQPDRSGFICAQPSDCIVVPKHCCSCGGPDAYLAMNEEGAKRHMENLHCEVVDCMPCGAPEPAVEAGCFEGECHMVGPEGCPLPPAPGCVPLEIEAGGCPEFNCPPPVCEGSGAVLCPPDTVPKCEKDTQGCEACICVPPVVCGAEACPEGTHSQCSPSLPGECPKCECVKNECPPSLPPACSSQDEFVCEIDALGCEVCFCKPTECKGGGAIPPCPNGDAPICEPGPDGCPVCHCEVPCEMPPPLCEPGTEPKCDPLTCMCECVKVCNQPQPACQSNEQLKCDPTGCECKCVPTTTCKPPPVCGANQQLKCEMGSTGCEICKCVPVEGCGPVCDMECAFGFKTDAQGCATCECRDAPGCHSLDEAACKAEPACLFESIQCITTPCPPGACKPRMPRFCRGTGGNWVEPGPACAANCKPHCECPKGTQPLGEFECMPDTCSNVVCAIFCPDGFKRDQDGCPTCACR